VSDEFTKQLFVAKVNSTIKNDVVVLQDVVNGHDHIANINDEVECKYTSWIFNDYKIGKVLEIDASVSLQLGKGTVTKGLETGVVGLKEAGRRFVFVPPLLAYGRQGLGEVIPPSANLVYEVTLLKNVTADKQASAKTGKSKKQNQGPSQNQGSSSPKQLRQGHGDTANQTLSSSSLSSSSLQEIIPTEEDMLPLPKDKQSPTTKKRKHSSKSTGSRLSQGYAEISDDKLESPIEERKKPLTKPKPTKVAPSSLPDNRLTDDMDLPVQPVQKSAPVPIKPKPAVPKKQALSLPEPEGMGHIHDSLSPEPLPEKRDVASLKARLSQQTYMGRSPKQGQIAPQDLPKQTKESYHRIPTDTSSSLTDSDISGLSPEALQQCYSSALDKVAQLEKKASKLNHQLEEQENRHQNQLSLIRERYDKLKQMLRDKEEEVEKIKEQARQKVREKQEEAKKEIERAKAGMQKQQSKLNRKVSDLKAELSESDPGFVHIGTADLLRQGDIFITEDELKYPEQVKRVGQGQWGNIHMAAFRGTPVYVELVNQVTLTSYTRDAFEIEVSQAVRLRHPNIHQVLGVVMSANKPSLVTDIYESTIRESLAKRSFDKNEVIRYACDLSKALNFLHLAKPPIFHGNVTSSAVILQSSHQGSKACLTHDGLFQFLSKTEPTAAQKNKTYLPAGDAAMPLDAIDCYSLGVLICEMSIRKIPMPEQRDKQISSIGARSVRELVQYCVVGDASGHRATMGNVIEMLRKIVGK
jgi:flagellar biosynthesis GTPase FlhF